MTTQERKIFESYDNHKKFEENHKKIEEKFGGKMKTVYPNFENVISEL